MAADPGESTRKMPLNLKSKLASDQTSRQHPVEQNKSIRPCNILNLSSDTRAHVDGVIPHKYSHYQNQNPPAHPPRPSSKANDKVTTNYVIPQKRVPQQSNLHENIPNSSAYDLNNGWKDHPRTRSVKEKVIGGLSKEDELRAIWSKFDKKERRYRRRSEARGDPLITGNEVLGAWEEEFALYDLSNEEGPW